MILWVGIFPFYLWTGGCVKPLSRTSIVNWIACAGSIGIFLPCSMKDCMREIKQI